MFEGKVPACDICGEYILPHHWTVMKNGEQVHGPCSVEEDDYTDFEFFSDMGAK